MEASPIIKSDKRIEQALVVRARPASMLNWSFKTWWVICMAIVLLTLQPVIKTMYQQAIEQRFSGPYAWLVLSLLFVIGWLLYNAAFLAEKRIPKKFQVQVWAQWPEAISHLIVGFAAITLLLAFSLFFAQHPVIQAGGTPATVWISIISLFLLSLAYWITVVKRKEVFYALTSWWQRVRVVGSFNRGSYRPGDALQFRMQDRLTPRQEVNYLVKLQYVEELAKPPPFGQSGLTTSRRNIQYQYVREVTSSQLDHGVKFILEPFAGGDSKTTNLHRHFPHYWEILVEAPNSLFFARFFVSVEP